MDKLLGVPENAENELIFFVNGKKVVEAKPDPEWTLLWYLRRKLQLTGTKYGCGEGGCGACTVMVSQYVRRKDRIKHIAVNACLTPVCAMHGLAVTTVEGIGSTEDRLHPVQERLAKSHGSQCGFCTPGIVMSMYALLRQNTKLEYSDIETALQGNLCRCTGYRPIIESFKTFMDGWEKSYVNPEGTCAMGKDCCKNQNNNINSRLHDASDFKPYDRNQEPIFPPELKLSNKYDDSYLYFQSNNVTWIRPKNIDEILFLKHKYPHGKIVVGNTEVGVEMKIKNKNYPILIHPTFIAEMNICQVKNNAIVVGAAISLTELQQVLKSKINKSPRKEFVFESINDMLHWFAGNQVRNVASLVGNIITASPISDLNPILMACSCIINVYSYERGHKKITIDEDFFIGYRKTVVKDDEVVVSVEIPFTKERQLIKAYKQARRKEDDIAIVTAAFNIEFTENKTISHAKMCFGGMGPKTTCASDSSNALIGLQLNENTLNLIMQYLTQEFNLTSSVPGGMAEYRKTLSLSLFFKFYTFVVQLFTTNNFIKAPENQLSRVNEESAKIPSSSQYFDIRNDATHPSDAVGKPVPHASAMKQAAGEAIYCDDLPHIEGELYLSLVFSTEPFAKIKDIDARQALSFPEVVAFFSAKDLNEECNKMGPIIKDEEIFSREIVTSRSCVIGAVVARSENAARKAKDLVSVTYEKMQPVIITIEDAIHHDSYFSKPRICKKGNVEQAFANSPHVLESCIRSGAQEHFYLETISAFAIRREDELEIISSSQNPADIAHIASEALGIPNHKVISKVKRLGGGFGGKETRATILALPVAMAAYKLKKPVRAMLGRDEDMQASGYRHPFLTKYKVAFNSDGKINALDIEMYSNAGNSMDISCSMIERAIVHVDNCYYIPNIEVKGYICKTNLPSNTAFRGFGAPQAMLATEAMIRDVAEALNKTYEEIVEINMYHEGQLTHFNQILIYCTIERCWNECIQNCNYWRRKKDVEHFNRSNRWKKKGLTVLPTKYGISFQTDVLMQGGALLLVYNDGSVLLSIGGIEMGQGLFTKMIQVASRALEIDINKIHISEMSTDKVPNSSPTAASISSDLYGMAVLDACKTLKERIEPYKLKNRDGKWEDWVMAAYLDRVSLFATGFYKAPKIEYNAENNSGNLFEYFTYGVACSEVMIDCLTGDHQVLRTDIVMDVGESLNPAIDIGQIEGAFMQGYGFHTIEEMVFSPTGEILSRGPGAYKIPGFSDVPNSFNVSLLKGAPNPRAVYSSKAIGEPPLFLAASVFFAIKEAIKSARIDAGVSADFVLHAPATCERIRMACEDNITQKVQPTVEKGGRPWNVVV
ncbi:xanthine dehydrogenase-like [Plodia interpunctella]|uniref:xanthine dehydrogenase-like n=1 Tax=Plodia interpunctella TaxID=58824 RepID=UPI002367D032|nr:xanthine dehydrogenase-like [Plodia interpunctella]